MLPFLTSQFKCLSTKKVWMPSCAYRLILPITDCLITIFRAPSIESLKRAMQTYARQGGTSSIFVNDDGLRLLPPVEASARLSFYATHNIGWVARPAHTYSAISNSKGMCSCHPLLSVLQSSSQDSNARVASRRLRTSIMPLISAYA